MYFNDQKKNTDINGEFTKKISKRIIEFKETHNIFSNKYFIIGIFSFCIIVLLLFVYFKFIYNPIKYYLELNGDSDITIYQGMDFEDPGYRAYDSKNNDYNDYVVVNGEVNTDIIGEYILTYEFNDIYASRVVTVLEGDKNHRTFMFLNGDKVIYQPRGEQFIDPRVQVIDSEDYNLIDKLVVTGNVDYNTNGIYTIKYSVTNSIGVNIEEERTVVVMGLDDVSINYNDGYTNGNVSVSIGVLNNLFSYMELPNGEIVSNKVVNYVVTENGLYNISVHGKNGDVINKSFYVGSIDRTVPTASCSGYYKDGKSYVTVYASDDYSGVSKIYFGKQSFSQSNIVLDREYSNPEFIVYDNAGNSVSTKCNLENQNPVVVSNPNNNSSNGSNNKPHGFYECVDTTIYKGPTYSLTANQKKKLAAMAYNEDNYSTQGLRAVISHMANLYEYKRWSGATTKGFYEYITFTTWYAQGTRNREYKDSSMAKILPLIDDILVNGNRTIPLFVNNFDWFPNDIVSPKSIYSYEQGVTKYGNIYGAKGDTFWCFSLNKSRTSGNLYGSGSEEYRKLVS